jgi:GntR family transcriptional regulator
VSYFDSIYADTLLPPRAVSVYMYLKDRSNSAGSCWPGIKTIARDMNLSRSTVKRALADLEQHGYLAKLPPEQELVHEQIGEQQPEQNRSGFIT